MLNEINKRVLHIGTRTNGGDATQCTPYKINYTPMCIIVQVNATCDLTDDATRSVHFNQLRFYDLGLLYQSVDGFEVIIEKNQTHTAGIKLHVNRNVQNFSGIGKLFLLR